MLRSGTRIPAYVPTLPLTALHFGLSITLPTYNFTDSLNLRELICNATLLPTIASSPCKIYNGEILIHDFINDFTKNYSDIEANVRSIINPAVD